jgi:hypothetical protein
MTFTDIINAMRHLPEGVGHGGVTVEAGLVMLQAIHNETKGEIYNA